MQAPELSNVPWAARCRGNRGRKWNIHGGCLVERPAPFAGHWICSHALGPIAIAGSSVREHGLLSRTLRDWDGDDAGRRRILLLTSGLGLGHVRAAQAIEAALKRA